MPAAVSVAHTTSPDIDDDDELTGEQIDLLLAQATERLHAKAQSTLTTLPKPVHVRLPKLDAGAKGQPDDVVNGQSTRGIYAQEQDKAEAYGIRKVEDPIATKAMIKEVSSIIAIHNLRMKIYPNSYLEQSSSTVLVAFLRYESHFFHSYSDYLTIPVLTSTMLRKLVLTMVRSRKPQLVRCGTTCRRQI